MSNTGRSRSTHLVESFRSDKPREGRQEDTPQRAKKLANTRSGGVRKFTGLKGFKFLTFIGFCADQKRERKKNLSDVLVAAAFRGFVAPGGQPRWRAISNATLLERSTMPFFLKMGCNEIHVRNVLNLYGFEL